MTDLTRLQALSGRNPRQDTLSVLESERRKINEAYDVTIDAIKNGRQLDEGLFTNLSAALQTAGKIGKVGTSSVIAQAKKLGTAIKTIYQDKKAQLELKNLIVSMQKAIGNFNTMEEKAPTILQKDTEVKKAMTLFRDVFAKTISMLSSRLAVQEGVELTEVAVEKLLAGMVEIKSQDVDDAAKHDIQVDSSLVIE